MSSNWVNMHLKYNELKYLSFDQMGWHPVQHLCRVSVTWCLQHWSGEELRAFPSPRTRLRSIILSNTCHCPLELVERGRSRAQSQKTSCFLCISWTLFFIYSVPGLCVKFSCRCNSLFYLPMINHGYPPWATLWAQPLPFLLSSTILYITTAFCPSSEKIHKASKQPLQSTSSFKRKCWTTSKSRLDFRMHHGLKLFFGTGWK